MNSFKLFVLGGGGHAKVLIDALLRQHEVNIVGILDSNPALVGQSVLGIPVLGDEETVLNQYPQEDVRLVNAIGSVELPEKRKNLFEKFKRKGYRFSAVIHPNATLGVDVQLGEGVQIMAGAVIQAGSVIGDNVIINTNASVDHDCQIGPHTHIAPGVVCCGNVTIDEMSHIGSGAILLQGIHVGQHSLIAAGALLNRNVLPASRMAGIPAKLLKAKTEMEAR